MIVKNDLVELLNEMENTVACIKEHAGYETTPFRLTTVDDKMTMVHEYYGQFDFDTFSEAVHILLGFQNVFIKHGDQILVSRQHGIKGK